MKQKYLLLTMILFVFFFLFFATSLALIPGDFGSAGGGPPDGVVDFEDLMIFAMAYGSTPADANWNPLCDIYPDDKIDFEDLMIFAMNYGRSDVVTDVEVSTITYQSSMSKLPDIKTKLEEDKLQPTYYFNELTEPKKGVTGYAIDVGWHSYPDATGYKVYRSVNGGSYTLILDWQAPSGSDWYGLYDYDISEGNTYSYYVTAYGADWETSPSEIASIEITAYTFLPPCSLISPADNSIITDTNPVFSWNPVGLDIPDLPYGEVYSGETYLRIYDASTYETAWSVWFDDMTTSTATYDQNGNANSLISGNIYRWYVVTNGYNNNGFYVSSSFSETWEFNYGNVVAEVEAYAITRQGTSMEMFQAKMDKLVEEELIPDSFHLNELTPATKGVTVHEIDVYWHSYPDATGYKVYRSVNGGVPAIIFQDEPTTTDDWYGFWDEAVSEGNTYTYYVTSYGSGWETDPSQTVTIDTWLPPCSLISPADQSVITDPTPTFTWNPVGVSSFPYGSIVSGYSWLNIWEQTNWNWVWDSYFNDLTTSSAIYNNDGQATPLVAGNGYEWEIDSYGYDENGKLIAYSWSEYWDFYYGNIVADVDADAITYQGTRMELFQAKMDKLVEEELIPDSLHLNELTPTTKGVTEHVISVSWHSYPDATGYKVYRSTNGGGYSLIFQYEPTTGDTYYSFWDEDVSEGNSYTYYVTSYGSGWETDPSQTVTIDTWLPPCSLISPADQSVITDPAPTFTWNPVGVSSFPYGSIYSGGSSLWIYNWTVGEEAWWIWFNNLTTSSAIYNNDGQATPLAAGHGYVWEIDSYGYDENSKLIAYSWSEYWYFSYTGP